MKLLVALIALSLLNCGGAGKRTKRKPTIDRRPPTVILVTPVATEEPASEATATPTPSTCQIPATPTPIMEEDPEEPEPQASINYVNSICNGIDVFSVDGGPTFAVYSSRLFVLDDKWTTIWKSSGNKRCKAKLEVDSETEEVTGILVDYNN